MYESEDWDLNEDFLKDLEDINSSFGEGDRVDLKKRKIDTDNSLFENTVNSQNNRLESQVQTQSTNVDNKAKIKRRNVLSLFDKTVDNAVKPTESQLSNNNEERYSQKSQYSQAMHRRQRLAELFNGKSQNNVSVQNKENTVFTQRNLISSTPICTQFAESQPKVGTSQISILQCHQSQPREEEILPSIPKVQIDPKPGTSRSTEKQRNITDSFKRSLDSNLSKVNFVRKFPGPAGLLPDDSSNQSISLEDASNEISNDNSSTIFESGAFCSQRTKNLFTEGPWQLMLNDLPDNFLKGLDIATVKQKAKTKSFKSSRVPFLAGIVQSIDYTSNNPKVVLKDFSGQIECCFHCNITRKYPNTLDYGVVILLRDVGLIVSKMYMYAMVSLNSLVSIYSPKERTVSTPNLTAIQNMDSSDFPHLNDSYDDKPKSKNNNVSKNKSNKVQNQSTEMSASDNTNAFESLDDFFADEMDFEEITQNINFLTSENFVSSSNGNADRNENERKQVDPEISSKDDTLDSLFDMDDDMNFSAGEHIFRNGQSLFSTVSGRKEVVEDKSSNNSKETNNEPVASSSNAGNTTVSSKKSLFKKKIPSALFSTNRVERNVPAKQSKDACESSSNSTEVSQTNNRVEEPVVISAFSKFADDLFSCDDDMLMSQIEFN